MKPTVFRRWRSIVDRAQAASVNLLFAFVVSAITLFLSGPAYSQLSTQKHSASPSASGALHSGLPITLSNTTKELALAGQTLYWIDTPSSESMGSTLESMLAKKAAGQAIFQTSKPTDSYAIDGQVLWMQFSLQAIDTDARWMLELGSPLIDDVSLHWRADDGQWLSAQAGDRVARKLWPMPTRLPTFALQPSSKQATTYYLRFENARFPVSLPISLYRDSAYLQAHLIDQMLLGALAGMLVLILLASVTVAYIRRELSLAVLSVYVLVLGLFSLTNTGVTPLYLWNNSPILADRLNYVFAALAAAIGPILVNIVVSPVARLRLVHITLAILAMVMTLCAALELWLPSAASYRLLNIGTMVSVLYIYGLIALTWQRRDAITRWVALCFAPVALAALPLILRNLGAIPNSWLTFYGVPIATLIELPLLTYALIARSNLRREGLARAAGLPSKDALTGLPNMNHFLAQMQGSMLRAQRFSHSYGLLLVELTNHAWFAKEHGPEIADRAVILASSRMQQIVRDVDMVCRLDESNFVILVEGACNSRQLTKLAANVSASGQASTDILPVGANLRLSICCALMPTDDSQTCGDDAQAQLAWLVAAAEATPAEQRKLVRSVGF